VIFDDVRANLVTLSGLNLTVRNYTGVMRHVATGVAAAGSRRI